MRVDEKREQIEERKARKKRNKRIIIICTILLAVCSGCVAGYVYRDKISKIAKRAEELKKLKEDIDAIKEKVLTTTSAFGESVSDAIF